MAWLELKVSCSREQSERVENVLLDLGALSVTLADGADTPIYEPDPDNPPVWPETRVIGLFESDADLEMISRLVAAETGLPDTRMQRDILEDRPWEREWLKHFEPIKISDTFWVYHQPMVEGQTLLLDPGLAFGTGTHPTTRLCLEWLTQLDLRGKQLIDYGCGSGILGIAALLRGAKSVQFIDIDPQALTATASNLSRNGVDADRYQLLLAPNCTPAPADILVANILAGPLIALGQLFADLVVPGGQLALSGLLTDQTESVASHYRQQSFAHLQIELSDDWARITGLRDSLHE
jgi:ribosomal protein L11 methyltransferase